jgi:zinc protease
MSKQKAASELAAQEAEPRFLGRRALYRAIFGDHPYSVTSPTKDSIENTTAAELKREYQRRFRPDEAVLVVVGDFDSRQFEQAARKDFGDWKKPAIASDVAVPAPASSVTRTVPYVDRPNSVQTAFYIGGIGPKRSDKDYEAASLANALYGGMFGSRLVLNIREDKGYTYSPFSILNPYRETGLLITSATVRNPVTGASFNEISYELNRMGTTSPEKEELERAKRFSIGTLAIALQSQVALAERLARYWVESSSPEDLAQESEKIQQVSREQVREAGEKYFPMWRMTTVAVGEEKVIKEQLAPFGLEFKNVQ